MSNQLLPERLGLLARFEPQAEQLLAVMGELAGPLSMDTTKAANQPRLGYTCPFREDNNRPCSPHSPD